MTTGLTIHDAFVVLAAISVGLLALTKGLAALADVIWMVGLRGRFVGSVALTILAATVAVTMMLLPFYVATLTSILVAPILTRLLCNILAVRKARMLGLLHDSKGKPLRTLFDVERRKLDDAYSAPMIDPAIG